MSGAGDGRSVIEKSEPCDMLSTPGGEETGEGGRQNKPDGIPGARVCDPQRIRQAAGGARLLTSRVVSSLWLD